MEKDKIRSWRQRVSFALVSHLSSVDLESHHPASWVKWEGAARTLDPREMGQFCGWIQHHFFKRGGKEFQAWLKLQMAFR